MEKQLSMSMNKLQKTLILETLLVLYQPMWIEKIIHKMAHL
jgi:hypothetical protein